MYSRKSRKFCKESKNWFYLNQDYSLSPPSQLSKAKLSSRHQQPSAQDFSPYSVKLQDFSFSEEEDVSSSHPVPSDLPDAISYR